LAYGQTELTSELAAYVEAHASPQHPVLQALRAEINRHKHGRWATSTVQTRFLALLIELTGARQVIEVGTFCGYGTLAMALALPAGGRIVTCEYYEEFAAVGRPFWAEAGVAERIDLRIGAGVDTMDSLIAEGRAGTFDLVFIDADKIHYADYFDRGLTLLRTGGLVVVDNTLWGGDVLKETPKDPDTRGIQRLNEAVAKDERVTSVMLPVADGMTLARKR